MVVLLLEEDLLRWKVDRVSHLLLVKRRIETSFIASRESSERSMTLSAHLGEVTNQEVSLRVSMLLAAV